MTVLSPYYELNNGRHNDTTLPTRKLDGSDSVKPLQRTENINITYFTFHNLLALVCAL